MKIIKIIKNIGLIYMLLMGIVMIIAGIITASHQKKWVKADAVISSVTYEYDSDGDKDYTVLVDYQTEDGVSYRRINLGNHESNYREGMQIGICFNPDDPTNIVVNSKSVPRSWFLSGGLLIALTIGLGIYIQKKNI